MDLIVGKHSISMAIQNIGRSNSTLFSTMDPKTELKGFIPDLDTQLSKIKLVRVDKDKWSAQIHSLYKKANLNPPKRIVSNMILETNAIDLKDAQWLIQNIESGKIRKIFCLDQVSDVENAGAIVRSAAFYGTDAFIIPVKGTFRFTPAFYRKTSGGSELLKFVQAPHLPKLIRKLQSIGVLCVGLSEHETEQINSIRTNKENPMCLIVGNEEKGISNAVQRCLEHMVAIKGHSPLKSLNVSVAAAIAMSKYFYHP